MSKSIELSVKINPLWAEYVSNVLLEKVGCSGIVTSEEEWKDEVVIKDSTGVIKGYLPFSEENPLNLDEIQTILTEEKSVLISSGIKEENLGEWIVTSVEIPDEEWAHSWKKYWHVQKITDKIVICPSWEDYSPNNDEIIISLDPGSAFGTGTHPTTKLCMKALENVIPKFETSPKAADIGTGSGILAVVAAKLGVDSIVGVDNDASVIAVAKENAEKNNVSGKCEFYTGTSADVKGQYQIVVANILAHVLIEMMHELSALTETNGYLILSGIISAKSQDVQDSAIQNGFEIVEVLQEDTWVAIVAKKIA
jgi:ribosomal protein L11 methyltransferase